MSYVKRDCYCPKCKLIHSDLVPDPWTGRTSRRGNAIHGYTYLPWIECDMCLRNRVGEANYQRYKDAMKGIGK